MFPGHRKNSCEEQFRWLFDTYKERLYAYVLAISHSHYMAEEITQEIFLKLWLSREELRQVKHPESYVFAIARNKTLNLLRKASYDGRLLAELKSRMTDSSNSVEEYVAHLENSRLLQEAINLLPAQRQTVYLLSRNQGLDNIEIARQMQLSRHTVKNHLALALRFIRDYLDHNGTLILLLSVFTC